MQLNARQADGSPLRAHLQAEARATGEPDARLLARPPLGVTALWECFTELAATRPIGMAAGAIPHTEIEAWQRLHGVRLSPWEVDTLKAMDHAALAAMAASAPKPKNLPNPKGKR